MTDIAKQLARTQDITAKVGMLFQQRVQLAQEHYGERVKTAFERHVAGLMTKPMSPWDVWTNWYQYSTDFAQRSLLFWDTLRQRGNNFVEHTRQGMPPVLHFAYETVLDARGFERPVNYALVRIVPPAGVTVDARRRPYVVIDPRAGHGP